MKKVQVSFDYDGFIIVAKGIVLDSLYVDDLIFEIKDHNDNTVYLDKNINEDIREYSEEMILEKYNDLELPF